MDDGYIQCVLILISYLKIKEERVVVVAVLARQVLALKPRFSVSLFTNAAATHFKSSLRAGRIITKAF